MVKTSRRNPTETLRQRYDVNFRVLIVCGKLISVVSDKFKSSFCLFMMGKEKIKVRYREVSGLIARY